MRAMRAMFPSLGMPSGAGRFAGVVTSPDGRVVKHLADL
jgi:hypothetical protein